MIDYFKTPSWSFLFWIVLLVVAVLFVLDRRGSHVLDRFVSTTMSNRLVHRMSNVRRWLSIICLGMTGVCLVIALMRPQWGLTYIERQRVGAQIMVCLDVSKSMLAEDVVPNRLERAKAEINDLLALMDGDQVGLIAFAGRATVLCPMTSDFSFFKLILDSAGPHSVGRGGTRLEEPIRKALDGFRSGSDVSRAILLITDGEDHDSHPVDAAKAAAERGIKILSVGFGDEAGSEIEFTDPYSGRRSKVLDSEGNPVVTRLDGETLRNLAMETDGAYIPAGTGMLDLNSIYDAHIAPLMRGQVDDRGHAVRNDAFQWAVLLGIVFFVASVLLGSGNIRSKVLAPMVVSTSNVGARAAILSAVVSIVLGLQQSSLGQADETTTTATPAIEQTPTTGQTATNESGRKDSIDEEDIDPRSLFNESLAFLAADMDKAERLLTKVRRKARTDGEARFRATYNLGWVAIHRADELVDEKPELALQQLRQAADWFRDAIRLRPEHNDARHNLEVVMRRILELSDAIAQKDAQDLTKQLETVINAQRGLVGQLRQLVERLDITDDTNAADQLRSQFQRLALEQRKNISDSQDVSSMAREELDALEGKTDEQKTPADQIRQIQLTSLLHYTNQADQRLGQARSQMRRREALRAFRRAATGLTELKRARDQLRNPVELISVIVADATSVAELTKAKSLIETMKTVDEEGNPGELKLPSWATTDYLKDEQASITQRLTELVTRLQAGIEQAANTQQADEASEANADAQEFIAKLQSAMPFLSKGNNAFIESDAALEASDLSTASDRQIEAIDALRSALERFMELKRLINLAYSEEMQIQQLLSPPPPTDDDALDRIRGSLEEPTGFAKQLQTRNLDRADRIERFIVKRSLELQSPPTDPTAEKESDDQAANEQELQRYRQAKELLQMAQSEMTAADMILQSKTNGAKEEPNEEVDDSEADRTEDTALSHASQAVEYLQSLRRLFYSIVEHLRETAERQAELNDKTEQLAVSDGADLPSKIGPLSRRQQELRSLAQAIAQALDEQSKQNPGNGSDAGQADPQQQQVSKQMSDASKLVAEGEASMNAAMEAMSLEEVELEPIRNNQDDALRKLAEALALLQPPPPPEQQNQQEQQPSDQEQQSEQTPEQNSDPSQLLQAIRDREAQRRREQDKRRQQLRSAPVDKDW